MVTLFCKVDCQIHPRISFFGTEFRKSGNSTVLFRKIECLANICARAILAVDRHSVYFRDPKDANDASDSFPVAVKTM